MRTPQTDLFFLNLPQEAVLYDAFCKVLTALQPYEVRVAKTQISLVNRRVFACASIRARGTLIVSFVLPARVASERIWQAVQSAPGRWTHHIKITAAEEMDDKFLGWLTAAFLFAGR